MAVVAVAAGVHHHQPGRAGPGQLRGLLERRRALRRGQVADDDAGEVEVGAHRRLCSSSGTVIAPVMIATASCIEWVRGLMTAARPPSLCTWMRSAVSKTLGML